MALSTRGGTAFRVRVLPAGASTALPIETPMLEPEDNDAEYTLSDAQGGTGIKASFGEVVVTSRDELVLIGSAGQTLTTSDPVDVTGLSLMLLSSTSAEYYGRGGSPEDSNRLTGARSRPFVCNRGSYAPHYYSTDGYAALGVVDAVDWIRYPVLWDTAAGRGVQWSWEHAHVSRFDLYLMPAPTLLQGTLAYYGLIGAPAVPPKYLFGFIASAWGWTDRAYIEETLSKFRSGHYPVDAIIVDFEWFTLETDYGYQPWGEESYRDFAFNPLTFPEPKSQLTDYLDKFKVHVGGIRKPRLGNTLLLDTARENGWLLPGGTSKGICHSDQGPDTPETYANDRNLNYSNVDLRDWYSKETVPLIDMGMSFWWNDEGETSYFTYYWWNIAEMQALRSSHELSGSSERPAVKRFFSLNRAWSPGMARLGAAVWTGDVYASWDDLASTPGIVLNWILSGAPYVSCDIGGFIHPTWGHLLTRWMQVGVFLPLMRVHSEYWAPKHWPWLYGDETEHAYRLALQMRYRLVPYHYSLAHHQFRLIDLWLRPMAADYEQDEVAKVITDQWLDGDLLVAPLLSESSARSVYLPEGVWHPFTACPDGGFDLSGKVLKGPVTLSVQDIGIDRVPAFAKAGAIVPLASPNTQYTGSLPYAGPLEVRVYAGTDASFHFIEDDGWSVEYEAGIVRSTLFAWDETEGSFSFVSEEAGALPDEGGGQAALYTTFFVSVYEQDGTIRRSAKQSFSAAPAGHVVKIYMRSDDVEDSTIGVMTTWWEEASVVPDGGSNTSAAGPGLVIPLLTVFGVCGIVGLAAFMLNKRRSAQRPAILNEELEFGSGEDTLSDTE